MFPSNEAETIELYKLCQHRLGWRIVHLQTAFPDAILQNGTDKLTVEFEYLSNNFRKHGHDPNGCDLIVCYRDNWPDSPVPVQELEPYTKEEVKIIRRLLGRIRIKDSREGTIEPAYSLPHSEIRPKLEQKQVEPDLKSVTPKSEFHPMEIPQTEMKRMDHWFKSLLHNLFSKDMRHERKIQRIKRKRVQFCSICGSTLRPSTSSGEIHYSKNGDSYYFVYAEWACEKCGYIRHDERIEYPEAWG